MFQVEPKNGLILDGTDQGTITLTLTLPFACGHNLNCPLLVAASIPYSAEMPCEVTTIKAGDAKCGASFTIPIGSYIQTQNISVQAVVGNNFNAFAQDFAIHLRVHNPFHPFMHDYALAPIRVSCTCRKHCLPILIIVCLTLNTKCTMVDVRAPHGAPIFLCDKTGSIDFYSYVWKHLFPE